MFQPFPFVLLRTPLQSLRKAFHSSLNKNIPIFEEGIYLSSPEFWKEWKKRDQLTGKAKEKLERTYNKYWLRSCMRCTPYGTFAGCTIADITDDATNLCLKDNNQHVRKIRLDMNYMAEIIQAIIQIPHIQNQIKFFSNNSLYELPDAFRYAEYSILNNTRSYHLTSIQKTDYIKNILYEATNGKTIGELVNILLLSEEVSREEATDFIINMWHSQLLIPELDPCVTGKEPLDQLIYHLTSLKDVDELLTQLKKIQHLTQHPKEGITYYQNIEQEFKNLGITAELPKNTLQTDLFLSTQNNTIDRKVVAAILHQVKDLLLLARRSRNRDIEDFKNMFSSKYEEAEVPLAIVLDADTGIGYAGVRDELAGGSELVDDLYIEGRQQNESREFDYICNYTLSKYEDYLKNKKQFIEITEEELIGFKKQTEEFRFSNSMYVMGNLIKKDGLFDSEHFIFDLSSLGGSSGGELLGRFTHGDKRLLDFTKDVLKVEEQEHPDVIYAEIAHLPQARVGNVLLRPVLRSYEIPYVGKSGADIENQIPVSDLMVSVRNGEIILRSKKYNKQVIPRLTTAHNFGHNSLPIYKFLCDLQSQGTAYPNIWDWGQLSSLKSLPRVVYKNLILQNARWKIEEKDIQDIPTQTSEYKSYFYTFRKKWNIPQRVVYTEGDNTLLIDFEQEECIDLFLHYLKRYKNISLEEFLFTEENCIVKDIFGAPYANELIIPFYQELKTANPVWQHKKQEDKNTKRKFFPYSEWLYFKVYCGSKTAEKILKETVLPFIEQGIEEKLFEQFFFIRYRDEFSHFRIRFYNTDADKQLMVQKRFMQAMQPLIDNNIIDKILIDTYTREIERYSANLIPEAEALFFNDSLAVLRFINLLEGAEGEKYRLLFAMRGIDMLLNDFKKFTLADKIELLKRMRENFFKEFGAHPTLYKQLNDKYRANQSFIITHFNAENDVQNEIDEAVQVFNIRSEMNESVIHNIYKKLKEDRIKDTLFELLPSYIHMFINRLLIAQQRKYELIVYHFLEKYYLSQYAIAKKKQKELNTSI